jgi:aspartate/glutamate racemase
MIVPASSARTNHFAFEILVGGASWKSILDFYHLLLRRLSCSRDISNSKRAVLACLAMFDRASVNDYTSTSLI